MRNSAITAILLSFSLLSGAFAFPGSTNTATVAFSNRPSISDPDWKWRIYGSEDSTFIVTLEDGGSTTNYGWQFRIASITGTIFTVMNTNITTATSNVTWTIYPTNMPPAGTYKSELRAYVTDTNGVRAVAGQGFITIIKSLFE